MTDVFDFYSSEAIEAERRRSFSITAEDVVDTFRRPVFVYGTLLEGFINYTRILEGHVEKVLEAYLEDVSICVGPGFPFMAHDEGSDVPVKGQLMYLYEDEYFEMMSLLDHLEGVSGGLYSRERVTVHDSEGNDIVAWAYFSDCNYSNRRRIESGSWEEYFRSQV